MNHPHEIRARWFNLKETGHSVKLAKISLNLATYGFPRSVSPDLATRRDGLPGGNRPDAASGRYTAHGIAVLTETDTCPGVAVDLAKPHVGVANFTETGISGFQSGQPTERVAGLGPAEGVGAVPSTSG